ncbi:MULTISPECIES: hypothetical protein [Prauserella salsuginis group]|uniref:Uncharacterized protein n=1 Tax=Prauserella salsuginis TaxID=387889 RepID=A0ABW6G5S1_9PSEU|nr:MULTISPECIES: hypothetical protein [Prauserella salsuginis group]MCR3719152.1 hypothetical protein [Prauserella flava]MCR3735835.1 hypothetical protein [Prauserella salsuginis]
MNDHVQRCATCPPGNPRQADSGLVCFQCSNRILRQLRELEEYLPTLQLEKRRGGAERGAPGFASTSPADDTTIHHTDWRTNWSALDGLGAVATIHQWARAVREDRAFKPPRHVTLTTEIEALRQNHSWLTCQPFVDEYARELREVHGAVRAAAGDPAPHPVGRCITADQHGDCGGTVYERLDFGGVQCASCHRIYAGLDLVRLRVSQTEAG